MALITNVEVKQSLTQKARGVGDVNVRMAPHGGYGAAAGGLECGRMARLESVREPMRVRDIISRAAAAARDAADVRNRTLVHGLAEGPPALMRLFAVEGVGLGFGASLPG